LAGVLLALGLIWTALFLVRIHAHQPNVDDYYYSVVTRALTQSQNPISALLHSGRNSPLVLFLAMPGVALFGVYGGIATDLPLLLLLGAGTFVLARRWLTPVGAALTALAVGLNSAVLGYSVMFNFAIASTAAVVWCFAAYLSSERFTNLRWSIGFGVAFAALILSRSIAPVYAVPLAILVMVDIVVGTRRLGSLLSAPVVAAAATVLVIAGPWWAVSGSALWHYLTYAGYQASSGYTSGAVTLTPASIVHRVYLELENLGWAESVVLGLLIVATVWQVIRDRRARQLEHLWMLAAWVIATLLLLASSGNPGTAFGLPLIAVTIVVCAVVLGRAINVERRLLSTIIVVLLCAGSASQFTTSTDLRWPSPPYRMDALRAGASVRTNLDALNASVTQSLPPGIAIAEADGPIINGEGLQWYARARTYIYAPQGQGNTRIAISELGSGRSLITTTGGSVFNPFLDQLTVESAAYRAGYRLTHLWKVSKRVSVMVWTKGAKTNGVSIPPPVVDIRLPHDRSTLKGRTYLFADVTDLVGVSHVTFEIRGSVLSHPLMIAAAPLLYGWIARLNANELANGVYTVTCRAESVDGKDGGHTVTVDVRH
jgi:hypothetical protein